MKKATSVQSSFGKMRQQFRERAHGLRASWRGILVQGMVDDHPISHMPDTKVTPSPNGLTPRDSKDQVGLSSRGGLSKERARKEVAGPLLGGDVLHLAGDLGRDLEWELPVSEPGIGDNPRSETHGRGVNVDGRAAASLGPERRNKARTAS
jgi:hypothetical protein